MYGSYYYSKGIYNTWRPGYFYLTNKRLILYRQDFDEITFQIPLEEIKALVMREEAHFVKEKKKQVLYLIDKKVQVHRFSAVGTNQLKDAIEQNLANMGLSLEASTVLPEFESEETETCPQCGKPAPAKELLEEGCSSCGWASPVRDKKSHRVKTLA